MARLIGEKREGSVSCRRNRGINSVESQLHYLVQTSTNFASREEVVTTQGLPQLGMQDAIYGVVTSVDCSRRTDNARIWDVTITWSTDVNESQQNLERIEQMGNPTVWVPLGELNFERYEIPTKYMWNDQIPPQLNVPVNNSRQEFIDNGRTIARTQLRIDFWQFEPITVTYRELLERNETMNRNRFIQVEPKRLLLTINKATVYRFYNYRLWLVEYSLKYRQGDGWRYVEADISQGTNPFYDPEPGLSLDGNGTSRPGDPAKLYFNPYPQSEFETFLRLKSAPFGT